MPLLRYKLPVSTRCLLTICWLRSTIRDFQGRYDTESRKELSIKAANETLTIQDVDHDQFDADLLEWKTTRRNLAFANAALSISSAQRFITDENVSNSKTSASHRFDGGWRLFPQRLDTILDVF